MIDVTDCVKRRMWLTRSLFLMKKDTSSTRIWYIESTYSGIRWGFCEMVENYCAACCAVCL